MGQNLLDIISGAVLIQLTFLLIFVLSKKTENPMPNRILAMLLASEFMCVFNLMLFRFQSVTLKVVPHLFMIGSSFFFLWGPLLFLYTQSITHSHFRLKTMHAFHGIPFLAHVAYMSLHFHRFGIEAKRHLVRTLSFQNWTDFTIIQTFMQVQILVYTLLSFRELSKYRTEIRNSMSSIEQYNLSWLAAVLIGFSAHWTFDTLYYAVQFANRYGSLPLAIAAMIIFLISIQVMVYKSLNQPMIRFGLSEKPKYRSSQLTDTQKRDYLKKLEKIMRDQKPYLDPMLTLPVLARKANISPRYLSQVLNENLKQNFFDYINSHRIEESKRLLREKKIQGKTVYEVLLDAGFNSKSSFNSAFKRYTGMTPTSFIRSV
jgi:AraC-like DNA-binding protein